MRKRAESQQGQEGFTLIEMMVSMALLGGFSALFLAGVLVMSKDVRHQQGQNEGTDSVRQVVSVLDKQLRYANAVSAPGATADGTQWVEWRTGLVTNPPSTQTCQQWRLTPAGLLQSRSWNPPVSGVGAYSNLSAWLTRATGIAAPSGGQIFAATPNVAVIDQKKQQLLVSFTVSQGRPVVRTSTAITLTAVNTTTAVPPTTPFCQEVPRS
jgi:prepilin-type N-terminal cleavage/methylation domain-containing protein